MNKRNLSSADHNAIKLKVLQTQQCLSLMTPKKCGSTRENPEQVSRSGGGSQVHQKEWNKQKPNEYEGFDLAEWDVICHAQIHCFHMGTTECFKGGFFFSSNRTKEEIHHRLSFWTSSCNWSRHMAIASNNKSFLWTSCHFSSCPLHSKKDDIHSQQITASQRLQKRVRSD